MKSILIILTVVGLAYSASLPVKSVRTVEDELMKFINKLPLDQIEPLVKEFRSKDAEFNAFTEYVSGNEFQSFLVQLSETPEYQALTKYLVDEGIITLPPPNDVKKALSHVNKVRYSVRSLPSHRSFDDWLTAIEGLIPIDEEKALFEEEMKNSADFQKFYNTMTSHEFSDLVLDVIELDIVQEVAKKLESFGVDFTHVLNVGREIFGFP